MVDLINKWKKSLARSSQKAFAQLAGMLGKTTVPKDYWDDLEAALIQVDMGMETTTDVIDSLQTLVKERGVVNEEQLHSLLLKILLERLVSPVLPVFSSTPAVILVVGVNGAGKTTVIAKLAMRFAREGKKVLLVGADTYRAAAMDQLQIWADRLKLPMVGGQPGADPGAVVFDGIQSAKVKGQDLVIIDTAGRLHTRYNLMEELKKVHRVIGKACPGAPHAVWLTIDATTGQNALAQAKAFTEVVAVTGIILTKLDTSARGGMVFTIKKQLGLPILFASLGEDPEDLEVFDPAAFVNGMLSFS